ncbi:retropepsin-like aspartic protease [Caulobacter mirabilis]|nr:retropepsin-like aspartic protease [Caulobacter mirabilis]
MARPSLLLIPAVAAIGGALALGAAWAGGGLLPWPEQSRAEAVIPLYQSSKRVLVMMRIGDHPPAPVVFDTGTNDNILDTTYAAKFGLPRLGPSTSIDTSGQPVPGYHTRLADVRLGGVPVADGPANVFDYDNTDEIGIFGPNSFPEKLTVLDLRKSELRILPKSAIKTMDGPGAPYLGGAATGLPALPVSLPGLTVQAILDTGSDSELLLPLELAAKLPLSGKLEKNGRVVSAGSSQPIFEGRIAGDVQVGPITLHNPLVRFIPKGHPNIGLPVLRRMTLAFDPVDGRTWVVDGGVR